MNVSLNSINTNRFSDLNLTLRNFDFNPSDKQKLSKREKEKRIKELRHITANMEKSLLNSKRTYEINKKKNEECKRENEVFFFNTIRDLMESPDRKFL